MYGNETCPKFIPTPSNAYPEHPPYRMESSNNSSYYPVYSDDTPPYPNFYFQYYPQDGEIDWNQNNTSLDERMCEFNNNDNKGGMTNTNAQCCEFYRSSQTNIHNGNQGNMPADINESYCQLSYPQFD